MADHPAVEVDGLVVTYGATPVLDGVGLTVPAGTGLCVTGENGTGKSTLLRNIAGLLFPSKGSITVGGQVPGRREPGFLQDVFMVPEEFYLPDISIRQFLKFQAPFSSRFSTE